MSRPPEKKQQENPELSLFERENRLNEALSKQKPKQDIAWAYNESPIRDIWSAIAITIASYTPRAL
jgi:hypothetical protein